MCELSCPLPALFFRIKLQIKFSEPKTSSHIFLRLYNFDRMGLNMDEAMVGVNANSLGKYGKDIVLNKWPMYLYAWGSGMNILYPLIVMPFVKILGLTVFSVRLPIVLLSIVAIVYTNIVLVKVKGIDALGFSAVQ